MEPFSIWAIICLIVCVGGFTWMTVRSILDGDESSTKIESGE